MNALMTRSVAGERVVAATAPDPASHTKSSPLSKARDDMNDAVEPEPSNASSSDESRADEPAGNLQPRQEQQQQQQQQQARGHPNASNGSSTSNADVLDGAGTLLNQHNTVDERMRGDALSQSMSSVLASGLSPGFRQLLDIDGVEKTSSSTDVDADTSVRKECSTQCLIASTAQNADGSTWPVGEGASEERTAVIVGHADERPANGETKRPSHSATAMLTKMNLLRASSGRRSSRHQKEKEAVADEKVRHAEEATEEKVEMVAAQKMSPGDRARFQQLKQELETLQEALTEKCAEQFQLEKHLRTLDGQIGLLIQHRITVEEIDPRLLTMDFLLSKGRPLTLKKMRVYGQLFKVLQDEPRYMALLARNVEISDIDNFLQTVMFSLYGTFHPREEHLLLRMFEHALELEYHHAKDPGTVMRSNTAVSRMMTTYTRRGLGQKYLKDTLRAEIDLLYDLDDVSLELSPEKVYKELAALNDNLPPKPKDPKDFLGIAAVRDVVAERSDMLMELTDRFIEALSLNIVNIPFGVRWLCKVIKHKCQARFEDVSHETVYSHIGGFFLLRYLNPALVSPEVFGIVRQRPSAAVRRNLTQVARFIQHIANNTTSRIPLLEEVSLFMDESRARFFALFDEICNVEDFTGDDSVSMLDWIMQKRVLSITPNELFFVHRLLTKHIDEMGLAEDDELRRLVKMLPKPSDNISRDMNGRIRLSLHSVEKPSLKRRGIEAEGVACDVVDLAAADVSQMQATLRGLEESIASLKERVSSYQAYLENVRGQSIRGSSLNTEFVSVGLDPANRRHARFMASKHIGPYTFKLSKLDRQGIVLRSSAQRIPAVGTPERAHVIVIFSMPRIGYVVFTVKYKGRNALFHTEEKFEDLLSNVDEERPSLRLGDLLDLDARRMLVLMDKTIF